MDEITQQDAGATVESLAGSTFETYLHYPFCERSCTFCHFHKRVHATASLPAWESEVIDLPIAELKLNRDIMGRSIRARPLHLGGGTPSLMSNENLCRLVDNREKHMVLTDGAESKRKYIRRPTTKRNCGTRCAS